MDGNSCSIVSNDCVDASFALGLAHENTYLDNRDDDRYDEALFTISRSSPKTDPGMVIL